VLELAGTDDQEPVEALAADAANPALHVRVRVRRLNRSQMTSPDVAHLGVLAAIVDPDRAAETAVAPHAARNERRAESKGNADDTP
jgi:hypothetical protein